MTKLRSGLRWAAVAIMGATVTAVSTTARIESTLQDEGRRDENNSGRAKNVILFLGDGMGDSEITIARNYYAGAAGRQQMGDAGMRWRRKKLLRTEKVRGAIANVCRGVDYFARTTRSPCIILWPGSLVSVQ